MARARMTRSELKAQDEITTTLRTFTEAAVARGKELLTAGAVLLVVIAALVGWRMYSANRTAAAQRQLGVVIAAFNDSTLASDAARFEKTIGEAQKMMADYGSHRAATIAQYYMAVSQDGLGDPTNAVMNLEEVIGRGDPGIRPVAQFALAGLYKKQGEFQKAIDVLKQLEESGGYSRSAVAFEVAAASEAAGQSDQAQTYYSKVITESPDSPFRSDAEGALKRMGAPVPTPPPPVTPVTP